MKLSIFTSRFPYPLEKGDKLRLFHQIRSLSEHFDIYLLSIIEKDIDHNDYSEVKTYCKEIKTYKITKSRRILHVIKALFSNIPLQVAYNYDKEVMKQMKSDLNAFKCDVIYCQLARMAHYIKDSTTPKGIDYMDVFSVGMAKRAKIVNPLLSLLYSLEAKRMATYEKKIAGSFDFKTIISEQDKTLISIDSIEVVPNGVDTDYFTIQEKNKPSFEIGFVGNMGYLPNVAGAEFLVKEILPLLKKSNPSVKVSIAGARPHQRVEQLASNHVNILGWLEDIREAYKGIKIFVAPLFNGTGQQNKILEAMAMGVPIVTTEEVNLAIGAKPSQEILIANTAQEFANSISALLKDSAKLKQLSHNGLNFVQSNYSWTKQNKKLIKLIKSLK